MRRMTATIAMATIALVGSTPAFAASIVVPSDGGSTSTTRPSDRTCTSQKCIDDFTTACEKAGGFTVEDASEPGGSQMHCD